MSEDENTAPIEAPAWKSTRTIWSAGGVDLPETMNSNNAHFLADLKSAAANFVSAKTVSDVDRGRDHTPPCLTSAPLGHIEGFS